MFFRPFFSRLYIFFFGGGLTSTLDLLQMIHTASLFHDDVIDVADARRGAPSANRAYGDKLAILAGDFLLARYF